MGRPPRVALCDFQQSIRDLLAYKLSNRGYEVMCSTTNVDDLLLALGVTQSIKRLTSVLISQERKKREEAFQSELGKVVLPDLVVCEIDMGMEVFELCRQMKLKDVRTMFLSGNLKAETIAAAMKFGSAGYISKSDPLSKIEPTLQDCLQKREKTFMSERAAKKLETAEYKAFLTLSIEEVSLLHAATLHSTQKDIANALSTTDRTVRRYSASMRKKLKSLKVDSPDIERLFAHLQGDSTLISD